MKLKLDETIFLETIASVQANYPNIPEDQFMSIISLDPTYVQGRDSVGRYGKWLLNLYNKGNLGNFGHVSDVLTRFDSNKKYLKNKDIGQFKSIEAIDEYLNNPDNYNDATTRQKVRDAQKARRNADLDVEADHVLAGSEWDVWVPKTYAASCKLGQGSSWCTATTEDDYYYNMYSSKGDLYIIIPKNRQDEKWQFHFETESFMDINDYSLSNPYAFVCEHAELEEFFKPMFATLAGIDLTKKDLSFTFTHYQLAKEFLSLYQAPARGDYCGSDFIHDVLIYDLFKYFDYPAYTDISNAPLDELSESVLEELERLNITVEALPDILDKNSDEYDDDIHDAFVQALGDGELIGAMDECYNDLIKTILNSDVAGIFVTQVPDGFEFSTTSENMLKNMYDEEYLQLFDYGRGPIESDTLKIWMYEFKFSEPYYGWHDFSVEAFNDRLADCLYEIGER
jgi:hypothetical protein